MGADRYIPVKKRVESAFKRVQKLLPAAMAAMGQSSRGGAGSGTRGGLRGGRIYNEGRQQYSNQNYEYGPRASRPPPFNHCNNRPPSFFPENGGGRGVGPGTCFMCGATRYQVRQWPKA